MLLDGLSVWFSEVSFNWSQTPEFELDWKKLESIARHSDIPYTNKESIIKNIKENIETFVNANKNQNNPDILEGVLYVARYIQDSLNQGCFSLTGLRNEINKHKPFGDTLTFDKLLNLEDLKFKEIILNIILLAKHKNNPNYFSRESTATEHICKLEQYLFVSRFNCYKPVEFFCQLALEQQSHLNIDDEFIGLILKNIKLVAFNLDYQELKSVDIKAFLLLLTNNLHKTDIDKIINQDDKNVSSPSSPSEGVDKDITQSSILQTILDVSSTTELMLLEDANLKQTILTILSPKSLNDNANDNDNQLTQRLKQLKLIIGIDAENTKKLQTYKNNPNKALASTQNNLNSTMKESEHQLSVKELAIKFKPSAPSESKKVGKVVRKANVLIQDTSVENENRRTYQGTPVNVWQATSNDQVISYRVAGFLSDQLEAAKTYIRSELGAKIHKDCYIIDERLFDQDHDWDKFDMHQKIMQQAVNELNGEGYKIHLKCCLVHSSAKDYIGRPILSSILGVRHAPLTKPITVVPSQQDGWTLERIVSQNLKANQDTQQQLMDCAKRADELLQHGVLNSAQGVLLDALLSILAEHIPAIKNMAGCKSNKDRSTAEFVTMVALRKVILSRFNTDKKTFNDFINHLVYSDMIHGGKIDKSLFTESEIKLFISNFDDVFLYMPSYRNLGIATNINTRELRRILVDFSDFPKIFNLYYHPALGN